MDTLFEYILKNKEWIFSGVGVFMLGGAVAVTKMMFSNRSAASSSEPFRKTIRRDETPTRRTGKVTFADGTIGVIEANLVFRVVNPYKYTFEATRPIDIVLPIVDSRLRESIEQLTIAEARRNREAIGTKIVKAVRPEFARYGMELRSLTIGSISSGVSTDGTVNSGV